MYDLGDLGERESSGGHTIGGSSSRRRGRSGSGHRWFVDADLRTRSDVWGRLGGAVTTGDEERWCSAVAAQRASRHWLRSSLDRV